MSIRYTYTAKLRKAVVFTADGNPVPALDENGDPIVYEGAEFGMTNQFGYFLCDYQPQVNTPLFSKDGSFVRVSYKMYISNLLVIKDQKDNVIEIKLGDEIDCEGVTGSVVAIFPTKLNTEIWVK